MRVRWTEPALRDLTKICEYSDREFGQARAKRTALQILEAVERLADFSHLGRRGRKPGTSELVFRGLPFVAVYRLRDDAVELLRIVHGAQRWP